MNIHLEGRRLTDGSPVFAVVLEKEGEAVYLDCVSQKSAGILYDTLSDVIMTMTIENLLKY